MELALDGLLPSEQREVMSQLAMSSDDDTVTKCVKLRPPSSTKDLENVQNSQVHKCTFLGIINLGTLLEKSVT